MSYESDLETKNYGYIDWVESDLNLDTPMIQIGSGAFSVSTEPQKKSNPIGFIWPEENLIVVRTTSK